MTIEHGTPRGGHAASEHFDVDDPALTRFDLVREGARRDGVEIVHYDPRSRRPKAKVEKRVERTIALLFLLTGLLAFAFVVAYIWWPWKYEPGVADVEVLHPAARAHAGRLAARARLRRSSSGPRSCCRTRSSVQDRHDGPSPRDEQSSPGRRSLNIGRRDRDQAPAAAQGGDPAAGRRARARRGGTARRRSLIKNPNEGHILLTTGWSPGPTTATKYA